MKKIKVMAAVLAVLLLCACTDSKQAAASVSASEDAVTAAELEALQAQMEALASENEALRGELAAPNEEAQDETPTEADMQAVEVIKNTEPTQEPVKEAGDAIGDDEEYGRKNPAPIGTAQTMTIHDWDETYTVTMTVNWINRGEDAWYYIQEANRFNDPPSEGMEYIIANITATVEDTENDLAIDFSKYDFTLFSESSSEYDQVAVVVPEPEFRGEAYSSASITGNVVFMVDSSDLAPKLAYGRESNGSGGIWMALSYES